MMIQRAKGEYRMNFPPPRSYVHPSESFFAKVREERNEGSRSLLFHAVVIFGGARTVPSSIFKISELKNKWKDLLVIFYVFIFFNILNSIVFLYYFFSITLSNFFSFIVNLDF